MKGNSKKKKNIWLQITKIVTEIDKLIERSRHLNESSQISFYDEVLI